MNLQSKLVVAISSRALFDLDESHSIFLKSIEDYEKHQIENADKPLKKGHAFHLIEKLLKLNKKENEEFTDVNEAVEVIIISQNSMRTGRRVINSCKHYDLPITRMVFTSGDNPAEYAANEDLNVHLFLSHCKEAVKWALNAGIPSAVIMSGNKNSHDDEIRIAFDGDAVLFSDESEKVFQEQGLEAFRKHERDNVNVPLPAGPFKPLFESIGALAAMFPKKIKIGLITARNSEAGERVLNSFDHWQLYPDHGSFLGGITKKNFVKAFKADIFFDDHPKHCGEAKDFVSTAHVPNETTDS